MMLDDIFDIVTFIHPSAVQLLLNNGTMLQKYMFIKEKSIEEKVLGRIKAPLVLHLALLWIQSPSGRIPKLCGMNDFHRATQWISNTMSLDDFFNKYQHFYLTNQENNNSQYLFYESPPTYDRNWQWEADPHNFQAETKLYNGIRATDLSELFFPIKIKQQTKRNIAKLTQSVLLRGHHNRIYHHSSSSKKLLPFHWASTGLANLLWFSQ